MPYLSIVVPIYNEEENVKRLYDEINQVVSTAGLDSEFVFIDDGSTDKSIENLIAAVDGDPRVKIVSFRKNFGQTAAMSAGFDHANGEVVVTLDGDLQNDPAEIPRLIEKLNQGYDIVAGWRKNRQDKLVSRKIPSMLANQLISSITKVKLHDFGCTLKAFRSDVIKNINLYGEMHRFIPAVAAEIGVKVAEIPVNHRARIYGKSKYGIMRTFRVILDLLTVKFFLGYSKRPLHLFGAVGLASGGVGSILLFVLCIQRLFFAVPLGNRPLLLLAAMLVLIGLQFICFGLLAEILVRTYHESQNKKTYAVREVIGFSEKPRRVIGA